MAVLTVKQSGGDYTTLNAAVAAAIASDTISIEGAWTADDTTSVTWDVATSVTADASSKQIGRPWASGDTHYRLRPTSGHVFTVTADVDLAYALPNGQVTLTTAQALTKIVDKLSE